MEPYDDLPAVLLADHGITQGIQIFAKALCSRLVEILVQDDGEGSAVKILQLGFCRLRGSLCSGFFCGLFCHSSNLLAQVSVIAALEELDQSLSAAVDNACLFENGQKVRCLGQDFITVLDHLGNKGIEIFNALVRQFQELFAFDGITLTFEPEALTAIGELALERQTGARGLRSIVEEILMEPMFELPGRSDVSEVVVSEATVRDGARPRYVMPDGTGSPSA
jgi:hypothetical protein